MGGAVGGGQSPLHVVVERPAIRLLTRGIMSETQFVIPLSNAAAADVERVGPKAANLSALARAGLPTPGGFCLTADAYRRQVAEIGLDDLVARFGAADPVERRRLSVAIRLGLYEQPIAPAVREPLMAAWRAQRAA